MKKSFIIFATILIVAGFSLGYYLWSNNGLASDNQISQDQIDIDDSESVAQVDVVESDEAIEVVPKPPVIVLPEGELIGEVLVVIEGEGKIQYSINDETNTYTDHFALSVGEYEINAWSVIEGKKSEVIHSKVIVSSAFKSPFTILDELSDEYIGEKSSFEAGGVKYKEVCVDQEMIHNLVQTGTIDESQIYMKESEVGTLVAIAEVVTENGEKYTTIKVDAPTQNFMDITTDAKIKDSSIDFIIGEDGNLVDKEEESELYETLSAQQNEAQVESLTSQRKDLKYLIDLCGGEDAGIRVQRYVKSSGDISLDFAYFLNDDFELTVSYIEHEGLPFYTLNINIFDSNYSTDWFKSVNSDNVIISTIKQANRTNLDIGKFYTDLNFGAGETYDWWKGRDDNLEGKSYDVITTSSDYIDFNLLN